MSVKAAIWISKWQRTYPGYGRKGKVAKKGTFQVLALQLGQKEQRWLFPEERAVLAETQSVTFLISTEMKKSTKHF